MLVAGPQISAFARIPQEEVASDPLVGVLYLLPSEGDRLDATRRGFAFLPRLGWIASLGIAAHGVDEPPVDLEPRHLLHKRRVDTKLKPKAESHPIMVRDPLARGELVIHHVSMAFVRHHEIRDASKRHEVPRDAPLKDVHLLNESRQGLARLKNRRRGFAFRHVHL